MWDFVRYEGAGKRFVYIAIGEQAGQHPSAWSRRDKIENHLQSAELLEKVLAGGILEAQLPSKAEDGSPACGTLLSIEAWQAVE